MKSNKKCILVTGGAGFLGSHLLQYLVLSNYNVILLKRSTSDLTRISSILSHIHIYDLDRTPIVRIFEENSIHTILHCATNYGKGSQPTVEILEANLMLPLKLLEQARSFDVKVFINTDTILNKRINYYSLSKRQFSEWFGLFSHEMICINVALEHMYGFKDDSSKFVTKIIHHLLSNVEKIELTLGEQKREFIYIDDVVRAFEKILEFSESCKEGYYPFEVGSNCPISIREFTELVKDLVGNTQTKLEFGKLPYRENEVMESRVDTSLLFQIGWKPLISLEDGLRKIIELERANLNLYKTPNELRGF